MSVTPNISASQLKGLKGIAKSSKMKAKADAIALAADIVGQVGVAVIGSIYAKKNEKYRQQIVDELQKMNEQQINELAKSLEIISDTDARIEQVTKFLAEASSKSVSDKITSDINQQNLGSVMNDRKKIFIGIGVAFALLTTIFIIKKAKK